MALTRRFSTSQIQYFRCPAPRSCYSQSTLAATGLTQRSSRRKREGRIPASRWSREVPVQLCKASGTGSVSARRRQQRRVLTGAVTLRARRRWQYPASRRAWSVSRPTFLPRIQARAERQGFHPLGSRSRCANSTSLSNPALRRVEGGNGDGLGRSPDSRAEPPGLRSTSTTKRSRADVTARRQRSLGSRARGRRPDRNDINPSVNSRAVREHPCAPAWTQRPFGAGFFRSASITRLQTSRQTLGAEAEDGTNGGFRHRSEERQHACKLDGALCDPGRVQQLQRPASPRPAKDMQPT